MSGFGTGTGTGTIGRAVEAYLHERRRLGYALEGGDLRRFARYADALGHKGPLTAELQLEWARRDGPRTTAGTGTRRLENLRPFVRHYRQFEPTSAIVDPSLLGPSRTRPTPHIYTAAEIEALLVKAAALESIDVLRGATVSTAFGLLAATGVRLSEALALEDNDIDLPRRTLTVRMTKFRKSRRLPLHPSTVEALGVYRERRDRHWSRGAERPFLVSRTGAHLSGSTLQSSFEALQRTLGWTARGAHPQPRIHDLRHTFAVRRVQLWHEQGTPIEQAMFWLCTYLGHARISDTYWYLTGVPELMAIAGRRFEQFSGAASAANGA